MTTLTGTSTRTIAGYLLTLLEYPRWSIDRDVDFSDCHLLGRFEEADTRCADCEFGKACCWLNKNRIEPPLDTPLEDLVNGVETAVTYLRSLDHDPTSHLRQCDCDDCLWLREATIFLRTHRHRT
jgi:hypothetical protein